MSSGRPNTISRQKCISWELEFIFFVVIHSCTTCLARKTNYLQTNLWLFQSLSFLAFHKLHWVVAKMLWIAKHLSGFLPLKNEVYLSLVTCEQFKLRRYKIMFELIIQLNWVDFFTFEMNYVWAHNTMYKFLWAATKIKNLPLY